MCIRDRFAFLGPRYDGVLRTVFSRIDRRDIFHARGLLAAMTGDSMADDRPLALMIEKYINLDVLRDVARAYAKGRLLLIGTVSYTHLDVYKRQLQCGRRIAVAAPSKKCGTGLEKRRYRQMLLEPPTLLLQ